VRKNYDSLTLKLQDSLDQYERYTEKPRHAAFFTAMVCCNVPESVKDKLNDKWSTSMLYKDTAAHTAPITQFVKPRWLYWTRYKEQMWRLEILSVFSAEG
jgi:hypothetical protein